jgi:osmoprotectant transport system substrate-binding protein
MKPFAIATVALAAVTVLTLSGCSGSGGNPLSADASKSPQGQIIVGSADFPESQLLATIYAQALNNAGIQASTKLNIGSREVYMPALLDGSINLIPEYAGATLSYLNPKSESHTPQDVAAALKQALPKGITMLTPSQAADSDALTVTKETADKYKLTTIEDLVPVAGELVLGGPPEWKTRHEGVAGLKEVYGLNFKDFKTLDVAGPLTLTALLNGQIQVADLTTTDPAMTKDNLVALQDNKNLFPAQNIVPLIAADQSSDKVAKVLDAVSAALTTTSLIEMNERLANQESIDAVASDWLKNNNVNK